MMQKQMKTTKNYKTGKDFFSRNDLLFHFLGGCLLSLPIAGFFQLLDKMIAFFA